ncbi:MAG: serine/threonine protein kinase [Deltaproteobacteria bacterium]|nr:serine/threonine protein kinase [Deltaproteobacteria bacterium]
MAQTSPGATARDGLPFEVSAGTGDLVEGADRNDALAASYDSLDLPVPFKHHGAREESTSAFALVRALTSDSPPIPKVQSPSPPRLSARYLITEEIGSGGTAAVYEAMHVALERPVAVKVLALNANARQAERLRREARALSKLRHPSIIEVLDLDVTEDGRPYMVMELLEGNDLFSRLRAGRLPVELVIELGKQLCGALAAAHSLGVVHRDLKPGNVFLSKLPDGTQRLKLLDFGMAHVEGVSRLSAEGTVIGTPIYLAPEQVLAQPVDQRTDVYGAALVLYEMLTGFQPFSSTEKLDVVVSNILAIVPPKPSELGVETTLLDEVLMKGLAKRPEDRYPSVRALSVALSAAHLSIKTKSSQIEVLGTSKPRVRAIEVPLPRAPSLAASTPAPQAPPAVPADPNRTALYFALAFALGAFIGLATRWI